LCEIRRLRAARIGQCSAQRLADFPMVAEGINDSSHAPAIVLISHGRNDLGAGLDRAVKNGIGVADDEDHSDGAATERFGAEVQMLGRFVGEPKLGAVDGELSHDGAMAVVDAKQFGGSEGGFVEFNRLRAPSDGEHWG
jgi:hypothetical protein